MSKIAEMGLASAAVTRERWQLAGLLAADAVSTLGSEMTAIALPWFAIVAYRHQGLLGYFLGAEVVDRVASNNFARHGEWYGWAEVYIPTLLLGTLPWTLRIIAWVRGLPASFQRWRDAAARQAQAPALLLALWVLLPLVVFCIARSRLPLHVLPLFVPLALLVARQVPEGKSGIPDWRWLVLWGCALVALRAGVAHYPSDQDASHWAKEILARAPSPVLFISLALHRVPDAWLRYLPAIEHTRGGVAAEAA